MDVTNFLRQLGMHIGDPQTGETVNAIFRFALIVLCSGLVFFIFRKWLSVLIWKVMGKTKSQWDEIIYQQRFFNKLAYLVPPIASYIILAYVKWEHVDVLRRFIDIWMILSCMFILISLLNTINQIYDSYTIAKNRPITVFIQVFKIFVYFVVFITIVSVLLNKSPEHLIVGLGAFAAVLMLIFKDSILGFVAGVQLIANKMVRIGDWIVMPNNNANGEVLEINLYTVKVRNWDMTISTIPTYQLISQSFINWRGMEESKGRRIERYVSIDINTVHFLSHDELESFKVSGFLKDYIERMQGRLSDFNKDKDTVLDEQKLTNIGVFRQYMEEWLEANPDVNNDMTHMVRQLQPTATGIPIEIYCFSAKQEWVAYEKVQSDVFDHVLAVIPEFNLKVFQYPTNIFTPEKS